MVSTNSIMPRSDPKTSGQNVKEDHKEKKARLQLQLIFGKMI